MQPRAPRERPVPSSRLLDELALDALEPGRIEELVRRMTQIDDTYRQAAEQMGQLYLLADSIHAHEVTKRLDEPMRMASRNELMLRVLLDDLQARAQALARTSKRTERARRQHDER